MNRRLLLIIIALISGLVSMVVLLNLLGNDSSDEQADDGGTATSGIGDCTTAAFTASASPSRIGALPEGTAEILLDVDPSSVSPAFELAGDDELLDGVTLDRNTTPGVYQLLLERADPWPEGERDLDVVVTAEGESCTVELVFEVYDLGEGGDGGFDGDPFGDLTGTRCRTAGHHVLLNGNYFSMAADEVWDRDVYIEPDRSETSVRLEGDAAFVDNAVAEHRGDELTIEAASGATLVEGEYPVTIVLELPDGECSYDITMIVEA